MICDLDQKGQGHLHLSHWMLLIGLYLGIKYECCRWNSRDMTNYLGFFTYFLRKFDFDLWPWLSVEIIGTRVIKCALMGCSLELRSQITVINQFSQWSLCKTIGQVSFHVFQPESMPCNLFWSLLWVLKSLSWGTLFAQCLGLYVFPNSNCRPVDCKRIVWNKT